jgi:hypothetical protein
MWSRIVNTLFYSGCIAAVALAIVPAPARAQSVTNNAFNPAFSVILDGKYAHYTRDPNLYGVSGFLLGDEVGLAPQGFSLGESELTASANVDDKFYGQLTLAVEALDSETVVNLEEAFVQTTALPAGLTAKAGRFFSDIGYQNSKHAHAWDFIDQPLVYKAMLGNQYGDDGVHVHWVAPLDLFVEAGGEAFRGAAFPAGGATHGGLGTWTAFAHAGGDIGNEQSWRAGVSYLHADSEQRESTLASGDVIAFSGTSQLWIADFVWKWAAQGNPKSRNLVIQGEYLFREEEGTVADAISDSDYRGTQRGFYLQAVYQFVPRWRVGLRYDRLSADNEGANLSIATPLANDSHEPSRVTAMLDFSNSEFSRLRLQIAADESQPERDTQVAFQYVMSIGAHGAHQF